MRPLLLLLLLSLLALPGRAQAPVSERALESFYDQLSAYQLSRYRPDSGYQILTLPSTFSGPELAALKLRERQLVRVDLVYSAYRFDPKFDQRQLNLGRLRNLENLMPGILRDETLSWNLIEQTGCNSPAECEGYFHGFVLYIEKRYTKADSRGEVARLTALLSAADKKIDKVRTLRKKPGVPLSCSYPRSYYKLRQLARRIRKGYRCPDKAAQTVAFRADVTQTGALQTVQLLPDSTGQLPPCPDDLAAAVREGFAFASGFALGKNRYPFTVTGLVTLPVRAGSLRVTGYFLTDSLMRKHRIKLNKDGCQARLLRPGDPAEDDPIPTPDARAVARVLDRHPAWRRSVVVADVTGSMYPYTADLLTWLQLSTGAEEKTFVFFNDGNDLPDRDKAIGRTGGLYEVRTNDYEQVRGKVLEAMLAGGGGDAPENDCEALLRAQQLAPDAQELILIADNHTFPRDTRLLVGTRLPVRIILCGAADYINPKYLALARHFGYSLHTLELDLTNLSELAPGATLDVGRLRYQVTPEGGFRRITSPR
ncbi:hypothetical protein EJV47_13260 [Hymenobacter gummosus]|uniref:VWA domain-containing protein n=1 Tax=Hymenobacter gummosus TaxID=1776032 RepID=A0A431U2Z4_9BACT|nr:hypothetical protein [Hymenobacter gummosus]RTQ49771.1 hypothetical protein EJV47_13260 [Hymenobacter gummosus]